ncbi:MAG TPA: hypothetical protein VGR07_00025 [Thermoanaerobaculia bacterium]|jgi:hypothetical protein|nr:hypothetical protein [Thermoanaerobaculia bacterium]
MTDPRPAKLILAALVAAVLTAGLALAQAKPAAPAPGGSPGATDAGAANAAGGAANAGAMPRYDKATEVTLKGPIQEVKLVDTPSGVQGTHLMLKDGPQLIEVFAGPAPFFTRQGLTFAKGEAIEVTGSKVQVKGTPALLARQIKRGDKTVVLRDETGRPVWARQPS